MVERTRVCAFMQMPCSGWLPILFTHPSAAGHVGCFHILEIANRAEIAMELESLCVSLTLSLCMFLSLCVCLCLFLCVSICLCLFLCVCLSVCVYLCVCLSFFLCMLTCVWVYVCVCRCTYMCVSTWPLYGDKGHWLGSDGWPASPRAHSSPTFSELRWDCKCTARLPGFHVCTTNSLPTEAPP